MLHFQPLFSNIHIVLLSTENKIFHGQQNKHTSIFISEYSTYIYIYIYRFDTYISEIEECISMKCTGFLVIGKSAYRHIPNINIIICGYT